MPKGRKKLYIIGIDSVPLDVVKELHRSHSLKGFEHFFKSGFIEDLESTLPPDSAAAWPTIYTGLEPREHHVIDFLHLDKDYTKQLIYYDTQTYKPFWDVLAKSGIKSLIITPSMVLSPSTEENVDMVTGWPLEPRFSSKKLEAAATRFGFKGEPEIGIDLDKGSIQIEEGCKIYTKSIKARAEMSKYLIKQKDYDVIFVCFTETDRIHHYSFSGKQWAKYTVPLYKSISDFIDWTVNYGRQKGGEHAVLIVSDHGAQPIKEKFLTNAWLIENNFAILKPGTIREDSKKETKTFTKEVRKYISERAMKFKGRRIIYHKMPGFMKRMAEKVMEEELTGEYGSGYTKIKEADFEMGQTKAFSAISHGPTGMIWLNDKRFSRPGIKESEKAKVKREIIVGLKGIKAGGKPLIEQIFDGTVYYKGVKSLITPDIIFRIRKGYMVDFGYYSKGSMFMEPEISRSGDHTMHGIFGAIGGKEFDKSRVKSVLDLQPAIMKYFGRL